MSIMNIRKNKSVFIDKSSGKKSGLFCEICTLLLKTADDNSTYGKYGSCYDCFLRWIEARKCEWDAGWRPSNEEVDLVIKEKSRIFINEGDN